MSEGSVAAFLNAALRDLQAVPPKAPAPEPGGSGSGDSGGSGGSESAPPSALPEAPEQPAFENPYTDISQSAWYYTSLMFVTSNGIMNGFSDGTFGPDRTLSRAQLAQMLYNLEGRPYAADIHYTDTEEGAWYESAVSWATGAGILTGYADGSVRPNAAVSRQQLAAMLYRYARHTGKDVNLQADLSGYRDAAQIAPYAQEALQWANAAGIISGNGDALLPDSTATRAQTAVILTRYCTAAPKRSK